MKNDNNISLVYLLINEKKIINKLSFLLTLTQKIITRNKILKKNFVCLFDLKINKNNLFILFMSM